MTRQTRRPARPKGKARLRVLRPSPVVGSVSRSKVRSVLRAPHVVPGPKGWEVFTANLRHPPKHFATRAEAVQYAARLCPPSSRAVYVHTPTEGVQKVIARLRKKSD